MSLRERRQQRKLKPIVEDGLNKLHDQQAAGTQTTEATNQQQAAGTPVQAAGSQPANVTKPKSTFGFGDAFPTPTQQAVDEATPAGEKLYQPSPAVMAPYANAVKTGTTLPVSNTGQQYEDLTQKKDPANSRLVQR